MSASGPQEPDGTPPVPEEIWRRFLTDDERAIRATAPREPSARERARGARPGPSVSGSGAEGEVAPGAGPDTADAPGAGPGAVGGPAGGGFARAAQRPVDAVGELWHPREPWGGPVWRELDARARLRRVGRVAGTAAAVALALTAWSQSSTGPGTPPGGPGDTIGRRLEETALPTTAPLAPGASGAASPAVFEPAPSAAPRTAASPGTIG
ncbi:hypothetical protein AB0O68_07070 [Streptomyces sp. NPDC087512]|uniref:hypothetical protein n=1 Tax=Streptomyces sp. NPDC087512 TaxID=3155059 RepID=UPI00342FEA9D